jgi:RNA polymerase sigma-70 factor (ECF subfamily)
VEQVRVTDRHDLEAYLTGDLQAFERLVSRYEGPLLGYAGRLLGDPGLAQDVVQETFLGLIKAARRLKNQEDVSNWLYRVCRNASVDVVRKEARMRKTHERAAVCAAGGCTGPDEVEHREARDVVIRELDLLPENQRDVLILRVQQRKSYHEISAITGLSSGNVGYLVHHGLRNLARRLKAAGII